jgi:hypothetical protein
MSRKKTNPHYLGLLLVNRQLNREFALMPYSTCIFRTDYMDLLADFMDHRTQEQLGVIATICIDT